MTDTIARQVQAIRRSAAVSTGEHLRVLRIGGPDAFDVMDAACSSDLYLRDGQIVQTLLLDADARPFADAYVCRDDEEFILVAEGPSAAELTAYVEQAAPAGASFELRDLGATHAALAVDGPYAWELLGEVIGPDLISLPYRTFFHARDWTCLRAGKTGEFGYVVLLPRDEAPKTGARLLELGRRYDAEAAGLEALDQCALDNWFFCIRHALPADVTPIELQLQWRVSYRKSFVGSEALLRRRERGASVRTTMLTSRGPLAPGDRVLLDEREIGRIYAAAYSPIREDWVAAALLERAYAHSGVERYAAAPDASATQFASEARSEPQASGDRRPDLLRPVPGEIPVRTLTPPLVNNRSLYVDPRRHTYHHRDEAELPPLVLPSSRCV